MADPKDTKNGTKLTTSEARQKFVWGWLRVALGLGQMTRYCHRWITTADGLSLSNMNLPCRDYDFNDHEPLALSWT